MRWFQDRKTLVLGSFGVLLAATNLFAFWNAQSPASNTSAVSDLTNDLPPVVTCRALVGPASSEAISIFCSLVNSSQDDLRQTTLTLKNIENASFLESTVAPTRNLNGELEWDLGALPAQWQFDMFVTLRRTGSKPVSAWLSSKSDSGSTSVPLLINNLRWK